MAACAIGMKKLKQLPRAAVMMMACCGGCEDPRPSGSDQEIAGWGKGAVCPDGFHQEAQESMNCIPDQPDLLPPRGFEGHIVIGRERYSFFPKGQVTERGNVREFWLSFADERVARCIGELSVSERAPVTMDVAFVGRIVEGSTFGHLGAYRGGIQVVQFTTPSPCPEPNGTGHDNSANLRSSGPASIDESGGPAMMR